MKSSLNCDVIFELSVGARNRVLIGLSYRPIRLHSTQSDEIGSLESIFRILKKVSKFGLGLDRIYLPMQLTDWPRADDGAAAH
jgi:hypothetical protein